MAKITKRVDNKGRKLPVGFSQRLDGRYQARFTWNGKRYTIYDMNLNELKIKFNAKKSDLEKGILYDMDKITLNEWYEIWMKAYKTNKLKQLTYVNYKSYWKRYIENEFGKLQIRKISRLQIVMHYNELVHGSKGISTGTLRFVNNMVFSALEQAVHNDIIRKNPAAGILKEISKTEPIQRVGLSISEQTAFFSYMEGNRFFDRYIPLFIVAFGTGMRVGELTALTWSDIDLKNETISINKTLHYVRYFTEEGHHYLITTPKTTNAVRVIPMRSEVKKAFQRQMKYQEALGVQGNVVINGNRNFVFTTMRGTPFTPDGINIEMNRIVKCYNDDERASAIEEDREPTELRKFSPHIIRHTFASRCFERGLQPKVIQMILGHSRIETTLNIYTKCSLEMAKKEMLLLKDIEMD